MPTEPRYNFFASLEDRGRQEVRHVRVEQTLQEELHEVLMQQHDDLINGEEVPFDGRYHPTDDEVFFIDGFALPTDMITAVQKPKATAALDRGTAERWDALKSFFGGRQVASGIEVTFQAFDRRRSLAHARSIVIHQETFSRLDDPGLILDSRAVAVVRNNRLYFRSYINARRVLDLSQHYRTATNEDVEAFMRLSQLVFEDVTQFEVNADAEVRRKIALIADSRILETATPDKIQKTAAAYGLTLKLKSGRLAMPADKKGLKIVLRFLEENYFTSELSGTRFLTSSKRAVR